MRGPSFRRILTIATLVAVFIALLLWGEPLWGVFRDRDRMEAVVQSWGAWGPLAIILLQVLQTLLAPVPGQVIGFVSGYLYGIWGGTLYCIAGTLLGTFLALLLVRRYGRSMVVALSSPRTLARLDEWLDQHALSSRRGELFLFLIFLFPFTPSDVASLAAGLTSLPIGRIMLLAAIGRFPGVLVPVLIGAGSVEITTAQWAVLIAALSLVALLFVRYGDRLEQCVLDIIGRFG